MMEEILVGLDGSAASKGALRWALQQARLRGDTTVTVVHTYRMPEAERPYAYSDAFLSPDALQRLTEQQQAVRAEKEAMARQRAERLVEETLAAEAGAGEGTVLKRLVIAGDPAKSLIEMSRDADLLVLGSRGLGGFKGLLMGSVSQQCLHHAHCPVVVVR